jgi:hypothetical protein
VPHPSLIAHLSASSPCALLLASFLYFVLHLLYKLSSASLTSSPPQCYGLLHRAAAAHILAGTDDANFDANAKVMASQLRIAAGIFEYIATCQAPNTTGLLQERIPEKVPQTYTALSLYVKTTSLLRSISPITLVNFSFSFSCSFSFSFSFSFRLCLAEAQQITVKKAMLARTSPSLVAKLMVDCRNRYAGVAAALRSISEGDGSSPTLQVEFLQPVLVHYVSVNRILIESLMYKYLGVLAFAAQ